MTHQTLGDQVRTAILWRSGTQILSQILSWGSTLLIVRLLAPADYGLFAMTSVVLVFFSFLNGYGFASSLIQSDKVDPYRVRQAFGLLLLINGALALAQLLVANWVGDYYGQPKVADLLRWQSLIYLATPFSVIPEALLTRGLEFRKPAIVNLVSSLTGACVALTLALGGWGVWTLVAAPIAIFWTRAILLTCFTRFFILPAFDFRGAGAMFGFGSTMLLGQMLFIVQSQADIFIAGRFLSPHQLGLYAEALFLTQLFAVRFVPPLNEVAFPAYARIQHDRAAMARAFVKAVRLILLIGFPVYFGLIVTAAAAIETLFGTKWLPMVPLVQIIALAMPVMTLQFLFAPAINAIGRPGVTARISLVGALLMPPVYYAGILWGGVEGLAWGWVVAGPVLLAFTVMQARPLLGISLSGLAGAVWPGLSAGLAMAVLVWGADQMLPPLPALVRLVLLVLTGAASYAALLALLSRRTLEEVIGLVLRRRAPEPARDTGDGTAPAPAPAPAA